MTTPNGEPAVAEPVPAAPQPAETQPTAYAPPRNKKPAEVVVEKTPDEDIKSGNPQHKAAAAAAAQTAGTWLGFYRQPPSVAEAWRISSIIDRQRIPDESGLLATGWFWFNRTERILLFGLTFVFLAIAATLLACAARPSRRIGLYAALLVVFVLVPWMTWG